MGDSATLIEFEHRHFERHDVGASIIAAGVSEGWDQVLGGFKTLAAQRTTN
jgi:hypothetical protein